MRGTDHRLLVDLSLIAAGIIFAALVLNTDVVERVLHTTKSIALISSFVAGLFFTSILTTAPAIVALGEIADAQGVLITAAVGAAGAVIGDSILFYAVRDRISERITGFVTRRMRKRRGFSLVNPTVSRWLLFVIGGIIIASPLPDELGISLLGVSKMHTTLFVPVSFFFNFIGILIIGLIAGAAL